MERFALKDLVRKQLIITDFRITNTMRSVSKTASVKFKTLKGEEGYFTTNDILIIYQLQWIKNILVRNTLDKFTEGIHRIRMKDYDDIDFTLFDSVYHLDDEIMEPIERETGCIIFPEFSKDGDPYLVYGNDSFLVKITKHNDHYCFNFDILERTLSKFTRKCEEHEDGKKEISKRHSRY